MEMQCQSCGMPLREEEDFGSNADGKKNEEYCIHCYSKGAFTVPSRTMEEMICLVVSFHKEMKMTEEEARRFANDLFPSLKRWKKK